VKANPDDQVVVDEVSIGGRVKPSIGGRVEPSIGGRVGPSIRFVIAGCLTVA
jgi:hypothetical protein